MGDSEVPSMIEIQKYALQTNDKNSKARMTAAAGEALVYIVYCDLPSVEPVHTSAPSPRTMAAQMSRQARVCCVSPSIPAPDNMRAAAAGH